MLIFVCHGWHVLRLYKKNVVACLYVFIYVYAHKDTYMYTYTPIIHSDSFIEHFMMILSFVIYITFQEIVRIV